MSQKPHLVKAMLLLLATFLLLTGMATATNKIRLATPVVQNPISVGDSIEIPVMIQTDTLLGAFTLGFKWNNPYLKITSTNLDNWPGTAIQLGGWQEMFFGGDTNLVLVGWIDLSGTRPLKKLPAEVELCRLNAVVQPGAVWSCINFDSSFVPPAAPFIFVPKVGTKFAPIFQDNGDVDVILGHNTDCPGPVGNPPVANCFHELTVFADNTCHAAANIDSSSYDPDAGDVITLLQVPAGPYALGDTPVMLIVTDNTGKADTCYSTVHVVDNTPPTIVCPSNIIKGNDAGQCGATVTFSVTATDFCTASPTVVVTPPSGSVFPIGMTQVMAVATDGAGLKDTCYFNVTVNDTEKPVPTCPGNIVVDNASGQCGAVVEYGVTAGDNCPGVSAGPSIPSGSFFPVGVTPVWIVAVDAAGNKDSCVFTVTVNDVQPPLAQCNGNVVKDNDPGLCGAIATFEFSATDQCPGVSVVAVPASGSFFPIGVTQVAVIATDAAGLKDTCFFDVTVNDIEKPVIVCPTDIVVSVDPGQTEKVVEFAPVVTDNCPGATFVATPPSGSAFPLGITTVNVVATDAHGLIDSCQFTIEVKVGAIPDFAVEAAPDTITVTAGIPDSLLFTVDVAQIDGYDGMVSLSVSTLPEGVVLDFGTNPVGVPGSTTLGGHTSLSTPAGSYELTITAAAVPTRMAHTTTVWLIVNPCTEPPVPAVSQEVFNIEVTAGENHYSDSLFVRNNAPCGIFYWAASSDQSWVIPEPLYGQVNAGDDFGSILHLNYNVAALPPNTYVAHVMVTEDKKKVVGAEITINLTVNPKPASNDSVTVVDAMGSAGGMIPVQVTFLNNEPISGMSAGLTWSSNDVTLDSVSFIGSRIDYIGAKFANIDNGNRRVSLGAVVIPPEDLVLPGQGLWATLWFTAGSNCPTTVYIDSMYIHPGVELIFTDSLAQIINPQFAMGMIEIDCIVPPCISGTIEDESHTPIVGATVELYAGYPPVGMPLATTTSDGSGYYEFCANPAARSIYSVRAYKSGYYPAFAEAYLPTTDLVLTLMPITGTVTPTYEWVNLYCELNALFMGAPVLPNSVIEAYDPQGVLCGKWTVAQVGTYGFMPVYRDDQYTPSIDEGCLPGDPITIKVDGYVATLSDPLHWGVNGDRYQVCFDVTPVPPSHCMILKQGWNLVSWNIDTPIDNIEVIAADVMDNVDVILSFEQGAQTYDPLLPDFSTLDYADHYHGFWFRMNAEDTLCLEGPMVAASTPIDLETNWNLVSYLPIVPLEVPVALTSIFDKVLVVLGYDQGAQVYDPNYPQFNNLDEMKPDFGYWIKTTQAATLIYPGPILAKAVPTVQKSEFTPRTQQSNNWVSLFGSDVKLNGAALPVGTVIEAYDASGTLVGETVVRSVGKFGFMPVYGTETVSGDMVGKSAGSVITLKVNGEVADQAITWTENGDRIRVNELTTGKNSSLPTSFSLNQNYPNPFNPETSIEYVVAQGNHVELAIYNILGDKIKTLVSGYQAAGSYIVKWQADTDNGTSVASGVYFYKLTAGDYTDTKKMTLLK